MDPETLVTFLFRAPPEIRTVELLGSWDNFSKPYAMYHDRRRGRGAWSGCFKFHDIVFDGVEANWSRPRTGGLRQGGTYWYYFRLDDDMEAYDDSREWTTACPLMPGQTVNLMYVPRELLESPFRNRSASASLAGSLARIEETHTLEPGAKFAALEPPALSKVHARCVSDLELSGRLERRPDSRRSSVQLPQRLCQAQGVKEHESGSTQCSPPAVSIATPASSTDTASRPSSSQLPRQAPVLPSPPALLSSDHYSRPSTSHANITDFNTVATPSRSIPERDVEVACETSSLGPCWVADVRCQSDIATASPPHERHYSLHNGDQISHFEPIYAGCSSSTISPVYSPVNSDPPTRLTSLVQDLEASSSPTFSATTASSDGGEIETPFYLGATNADQDPRSKTAWVSEQSFEEMTARLRALEQQGAPLPPNRQPPPPPPPPVQTYRPTGLSEPSSQSEVPRSCALPVREPVGGQSWPHFEATKLSGNGANDLALPFLAASRGLGHEMSMVDSIFSELGYLGGAIR